MSRVAVCSNTTLPGLPSNATNWSPACNGIAAGQNCTAVCGANYTGSPTATCGINGTFLPTVIGNCTLKPPTVGERVSYVLFARQHASSCSLRSYHGAAAA
jgi:hypothetical protein